MTTPAAELPLPITCHSPALPAQDPSSSPQQTHEVTKRFSFSRQSDRVSEEQHEDGSTPPPHEAQLHHQAQTAPHHGHTQVRKSGRNQQPSPEGLHIGVPHPGSCFEGLLPTKNKAEKHSKFVSMSSGSWQTASHCPLWHSTFLHFSFLHVDNIG